METQKNEVNKGENYEWLKPVLMFYAKITSWIIAPLGIGFLVVKVSESEGWLLPALILGFLITIYGIYREIKIYKRTLEQKENKNGDK